MAIISIESKNYNAKKALDNFKQFSHLCATVGGGGDKLSVAKMQEIVKGMLNDENAYKASDVAKLDPKLLFSEQNETDLVNAVTFLQETLNSSLVIVSKMPSEETPLLFRGKYNPATGQRDKPTETDREAYSNFTFAVVSTDKSKKVNLLLSISNASVIEDYLTNLKVGQTVSLKVFHSEIDGSQAVWIRVDL